MAKKIEARFIIEIAGKPQENVEKALNVVLEKLNERKDSFRITESHIEKPELDEETTLYSGFLEIEAKFKEVKDVLGFIVDYTPTSIEILEPEKLEIASHELTDLLNVISSTLLNTQLTIRKLNAYVQKLHKEQGKK